MINLNFSIRRGAGNEKWPQPGPGFGHSDGDGSDKTGPYAGVTYDGLSAASLLPLFFPAPQEIGRRQDRGASVGSQP